MSELLRKLNNYCLYLLVFSITFENWDPFKFGGTLSVTFMASAFYIASWLPKLKELNVVLFKKFGVPLLLFIVTGLVATVFNSVYLNEIKEAYHYRVLLLIILMFLIANHFYNDRTLLPKILLIYVFSILIMFILYTLGVGVEFISNRPRIFGENPNIIGMKALIAFLIVLSNMFETNFSFKKIIIGGIVMIPLLSLVIASGSRGAFLSVFIGLALFVGFMRISLGKKIVFGLIGMVASTFLFVTVLANNADFQRRLLDSVETGDIGRGLAWVGAQNVIENNPIIGVGFPAALPEMYHAIGIAMDPHNVFLYVAMTTGLIGFCFFMIFIWRIAKILFLTYRKNGKIVYLVIFFIIILNMAKAGGAISMILFYFFFAALIGSTYLRFNTEEEVYSLN